MEHLQLKIIGIRQETPLSKSYFVEEINGKPISYKAGQFFTLIIDLNGKEVRRSYSISSTPSIDNEIYFTVKRLENGELSRHLLDTIKVNDIITALPPTGRFTIEDSNIQQAVFIAAGSGITPVFSLVKKLLLEFTASNVLLINQNKNEAESIFREELLSLQKQFESRFTLHEIFSHPQNPKQLHKRLNNNLLERILHQYKISTEANFYLCGPEAFMRMVQFTLKVLGVSHELIRKENFFATPPPPPLMTDTTLHSVVIHFHNQTHHLQVAYPETILNAALKRHIHLPYSCRGGRCSTCTAHCVSGTVKMSINDVLTPKDLKNGLILTCVAYPESDVEINFDLQGNA